jgi:hypothetical protein
MNLPKPTTEEAEERTKPNKIGVMVIVQLHIYLIFSVRLPPIGPSKRRQ